MNALIYFLGSVDPIEDSGDGSPDTSTPEKTESPVSADAITENEPEASDEKATDSPPSDALNDNAEQAVMESGRFHEMEAIVS